MNRKIKQTLDCIIERFKAGDIPEAVAFSMFPFADVPSAKWSKLNRTIMFLSGTQDARGFQQWKKSGRAVKKDSRAIFILVPSFRKTTNRETGEEQNVVIGFMARPVFRMEDTEGKALEYEKVELPQLPLVQCAKQWGVSVRAVPGNYRYYGYYSPKRREIGLASPEEVNFFHELAHCGHEKVVGKLQSGQNPFQEIVAELSAQALCCMVGRSAKKSIGNSYDYIKRYADQINLSVYSACLQVLNEAEQVLMLILATSEKKNEDRKGNECENSRHSEVAVV